MSSANFQQRIAALKAQKEARERASASAQSQTPVDTDPTEPAEPSEPYIPVRIITTEDVTSEHKSIIFPHLRGFLKQSDTAEIMKVYGVSVLLEMLEHVAKEDFSEDQWFVTGHARGDGQVEGQAAQGVAQPQSVLSQGGEVFMFGTSSEFAGEK